MTIFRQITVSVELYCFAAVMLEVTVFEAAKGAYMSVYTPAQKEISTGHVNNECMKNCVLSFLQPDSLIPDIDIH